MTNAPNGSFLRHISWSFIDNLSGTGINFVVGILLARYLVPTEFALVSIALFIVAISVVLIDGGFSAALIRKREVQEIEYHTTLLINIGCGVLVYFFFYMLAPLLEQFYKLPELEQVIRSIGLIVIIASFAIVPKVRLTRAFNFKAQAIASLTSSLLGASIALWLIRQGYGIWALVFQQLARQLCNTIMLWVQVRIAPHLVFSKKAARELFSFGSRILLSGLLDSLYNNTYYFVIGKVYTPHLLGLYTRAEQFSSTLAINFAMILQRVSLPTLTRHKDSDLHFAQNFRRQLRFSAFLAGTLSCTIWATADHLIIALVGAQWSESIPLLRILCGAALFQPLIVLHQNVLQVKNRAQLYFYIEVGKKLLAVSIITVGILLNIYVLLWGIVLIAALSFLINSHFSATYLHHYPIRQQVRDILLCFSPLMVSATLCYWGGTFIASHTIALLLQLLGMLLGISIAFFLLFPDVYQRVQQFAISHLSR